MRKIFNVVILAGALGLIMSCKWSPDAMSGATKPMAQNGNSLFHQTEEVSLQVGELTVEGEVKEPGKVNLDNYYKREVMVKEALYDSETGINFIGAYRYRGYSLFDLLHPYHHDKKNKEVFHPAIDLYVIIENADGETVVFSWSEIFHTNIPHQILIATEMAPIVPYKKEVDYPVGKNWKMVCANDLFANRMLDNPTKITVRTFDEKEYDIQKGMKPMYSPEINVVLEDGAGFTISPFADSTLYRTYYSSFYGMGMGNHPAKYFRGPELAAIFTGKIEFFKAENIRHGLVCFVGLDGYRSVFSFSELFNRTDQVSAILAIPEDAQDGGFYRIFHPAEFYADRSVKSLKEIYFFSK